MNYLIVESQVAIAIDPRVLVIVDYVHVIVVRNQYLM